MSYVTLSSGLTIKTTTTRAILLEIDAVTDTWVWVPRSVIEDGEDVTEETASGDLSVEKWFADRENLPTS